MTKEMRKKIGNAITFIGVSMIVVGINLLMYASGSGPFPFLFFDGLVIALIGLGITP